MSITIFQSMKILFPIILCFGLVFGCNTKKSKPAQIDTNKAVKVELKKEDGKFQLYVNKEPFYIKGAGLEFGQIFSVTKHGGNSFRTWRTENGKQSNEKKGIIMD